MNDLCNKKRLSLKVDTKYEIRDSSSHQMRDSNIEVFRIILMLLIVAHHYVVNSGLTLPDGPIFADPLSWRSLFLLIFGAWGKTGINCFVMITGYFMCKSNITARKFVKLLAEVTFYHITITFLFWVTGVETFSIRSFIIRIIPISDVSTGFAQSFLVFYLLIPFLNILVHKMTEHQHVMLLLWCGGTYVFLGTVPGLKISMNYVSWFCVIFFVASYIRLYPKSMYSNITLIKKITLILLVLDIFSVVICTWLGTKLGKRIPYMFMQDANSFLAVATGIAAFLLFKNVYIPYNHIINIVASSTFGVLLIHANSETMRRLL